MSSWRYRRFASLAIRRLAISDSIGLDRAKCRMTSPLFAPMMNFRASGLSRRDPTKVASNSFLGKLLGKEENVCPSRRDPMKVARYVVPGKSEKRGSVRTIDWLLALAKPYVRRESPNVSVVPGGTAVSFSVKSQSAAADTGYFHRRGKSRSILSANSLNCSFHSRFQLLDLNSAFPHAHNHRPGQVAGVCL
jgi:hypothetical protein